MTEWIDVNERLPEDNKLVLLYTPTDDEIRIGWHINTRGIFQMEWYYITGMDPRFMIGKAPSHWMELPCKPGRSV